jgi:hypothetical protein
MVNGGLEEMRLKRVEYMGGREKRKSAKFGREKVWMVPREMSLAIVGCLLLVST